MDLKKIAFPDHFPYCVSSPRRKVVSGFGLGVFASFIVLTVVFFNVSFSTPFLNPIFQGFNHSGSSSSNNTSILSWPFSFSSTTSFSSSSPTPSPSPATSGNTHEANVSESSGDGRFVNTIGNGTVSEKTHVGNFPGKVNNGSFTIEGGRNQERTQLGGTEISKNVSLSSSSGEVKNGNFSRKGKDGSFTGGNVTAEGVIEGQNSERNGNGSHHIDYSKGGNYSISMNNTVGNLSYNGDNVKFQGEEARGLNVTNGGTSGKYNDTTSQSESQFANLHNGSFGECDIFHGRWVRDDSKPYYPADSCPYIDRDFDCHLNKRPDDDFLKWKWQPYGCDIPSLNATDFLDRLRGKKLVFVGDSLNRNMWESLVCVLRHSIKNKKRVYEISGKREFKKKGFYAFRFEDFNCSVDFVSAPFLVRESAFKGVNGTLGTLRLDLMDRSTTMYHDADVLIFNTGHWWTHEKTSKGEDYYQEGNHVYPRLKVLEAYKKALSTWARWVDKNIDGSRTQVIFRGYSVTHFRGGRWNSGGQCHQESEPIFNQSYLQKYSSKMRALDHVLQEMKTPVIYLNISRLTSYRKDAHPSIYRTEYNSVEEQIAAVKHSQDCSHWCLPGVPDTWNELLYASLLNVGKGSWRRGS